jgi:hypothetical protein
MRSVNRHISGKTARLGVLVAVFATAIVLIGLAYADNKAINFEAPAYHTGSIDTQNGWAGTAGIPINPVIDQAIVTNSGAPASFGAQSWRFSNFYTDGSFGTWPFSPSLTNEAGETQAQNGGLSGGIRQNHYEVQWDFASTVPTAEQPGLQMSTASDRGDGSRMSYIRMEDSPGGLNVFFDDYEDKAPFGAYGNPLTAANGCGLEDNFFEYQVGTNLSRALPHTVKLTIDFFDGPRNDVVRVYVDGVLKKVGTTWEDYFRWCTESGGGTGTATVDQSRTVDSQIFQARSGGGNCATCLGKGFLIDNLSYLSSRPAISKDDCKNGGWQTHTTATGSPFKNQEQCIEFVEDQKDKKDNDDKDKKDKDDKGDKHDH